MFFLSFNCFAIIMFFTLAERDLKHVCREQYSKWFCVKMLLLQLFKTYEQMSMHTYFYLMLVQHKCEFSTFLQSTCYLLHVRTRKCYKHEFYLDCIARATIIQTVRVRASSHNPSGAHHVQLRILYFAPLNPAQWYIVFYLKCNFM